MDGWITAFLLSLVGISMTSANLECLNGKACMDASQFDIKVNIDGNNIKVDWKFNQSISVYGFQARIYKGDNSVIYESPFLHNLERSMNLQQELDGQARICVAAYENITKILDEKCEKVVIKDMKVVIGILAGVIFLIPCIIGISYIIYKDFKVSRDYEKVDPRMNDENSVEHKEGVITEGNQQKPHNDIKAINSEKSAKDNKTFVMDDDLKKNKDTNPITQDTVSVQICSDTTSSSKGVENSEQEIQDIQVDDSKLNGSAIQNDKDDAEKKGDHVVVTVPEVEISGTNL